MNELERLRLEYHGEAGAPNRDDWLPTAPPYVAALEAEVERLTRSRDFYRSRCDKLQAVQHHMRDPERQMVCDILANGMTYEEAFGHPRTATTAAMPPNE